MYKLFSSVQSFSCIQLFATPWTAACQVSLSITNSLSLLKLIFIRSVMPPNNFIFCLPLYFLPLIFPCIRVFSNESVLPINWPKYRRFSFSIGPSNEYSGLISFSMDWLDLLAVQGTLKSLLQHHRSKASILCHSAFFISQLSHPYMTTGKTIALSRWTFVGKVVSAVYVGHNFSSKEQASFNFMAAVPWKGSYDQPRQHIQKQRHYFDNKSLSNQGYGFSSGHVWM